MPNCCYNDKVNDKDYGSDGYGKKYDRVRTRSYT